MPSTEIVEISVGGTPYGGWKSMSVKMSARSPERTFQITGTIGDHGPAAAAMAINTSDPCTLTSNGDVLVNGRVHDIEIEIDEEKREIRIVGKSRGADAVKSSVDHKTHEWKKKDILEIAQDVDSSGIGYTSDEQLKKLDKVRCNVGDTQMQALSKLANKQGLWLVGDDSGGILITKHGKYRHGGGIAEGVNLKRGTAKFSAEDRMQKTKVKGHVPAGPGEKTWRFEEEAEDEGGRPGTVRVIVPKASMTKAEAKELAQNTAENRHGDSVSFDCTLQGFRDEGGQIWHAGWLVFCDVPSCRLSQDLAIDEIELSQDEGQQGSLAKIKLVHPSALGAKSGGKGKKSVAKNGSGQEWDGLW